MEEGPILMKTSNFQTSYVSVNDKVRSEKLDIIDYPTHAVKTLRDTHSPEDNPIFKSPYPCKPNFPYVDFQQKVWTFFTAILMVRYHSFHVLIGRYICPILFGIFCVGLSYIGSQRIDLEIPESVLEMHSTIGIVMAFIFVFRLDLSYNRFQDGRSALGGIQGGCSQILMVTGASLAKMAPEDRLQAAQKVEEIRRLLMILQACIRQSLREGKCGFCPKANIKDPYSNKTFQIDPNRPRLWDMMTDLELESYSKMSTPSSRMLATAARIKRHTVEFEQLMGIREANAYLLLISNSLKQILDNTKAAARIMDTPVPFQYNYLLNLMAFCYLFSVPFGYKIHEYFSGNSLFVLLVFAYYGVLAVSYDLEDPFGWDHADLEMEGMSMKLHNELKTISGLYIKNPRNYMADIPLK